MKRKLRQAVIVEGRYDKIKLSRLIDGVILETSGFGIFKRSEMVELIRRLAQERGIILFTDSDGAGFVIRSYLKGCVDPRYVRNAYIPRVPGKERRKRRASGEGILGVEGMPDEEILQALDRAGAVWLDEESPDRTAGGITKADLYRLGFSGGPDSRRRREALLKRLSLPETLSANAMLEVLNALMSREEFLRETEKDRTEPTQNRNREEARSAGDAASAGTAEKL